MTVRDFAGGGPEASLGEENAVLRERLREAEETLEAIRNGEVDAVVIARPDGTPQIYTLETADQSYRILVEEMQEGALTLSADGTVLYCNRRLAALVGLDPGRVVGGSLSRFIHPQDQAAFAAVVAAGAGKGEFLIEAADGRSVPANFSFAALTGVAPAGLEVLPDTFCCVVTDLTEQRRTGEALRLAHDRLLAEMAERERTESLLRQSQKMEAVGQLTGGVAHDFNNLLMVISAGLDMLDRQPGPERRDRLREGMRQAVQRGTGLTRQLLAFSRRQSLNPESIDLARQVEGMRELLDRSLRGDITVETAFAADLWPVCVDAGEFEVALLNLCVNARDAMPGAGTIGVGAYNRPAAEAEEPAGAPGGDFVCLTVRDTGVGMTPDVIAHAFEPFYTTKDIGRGSGLGLAQVYGFVHASGGKVEIASTPGRGTTISLLLPRSQLGPAAECNTAFSAPESQPETGGQRRVLLVEDDDQVAALTGEMLLELGYLVTRAADAHAALAVLAGGATLDLMFSDVMMPGGMNGMALAREVRRRRTTLPVVLTSGYADAFKAEAEGLAVFLLPKPYGIAELARVLAAAVAQAAE